MYIDLRFYSTKITTFKIIANACPRPIYTYNGKAVNTKPKEGIFGNTKEH